MIFHIIIFRGRQLVTKTRLFRFDSHQCVIDYAEISFIPSAWEEITCIHLRN